MLPRGLLIGLPVYPDITRIFDPVARILNAAHILRIRLENQCQDQYQNPTANVGQKT